MTPELVTSEPVGRLLSVHVGRPTSFRTGEQDWRSAIVKLPAAERVAIVGDNLVGDSQANLRVHGGPDKVICCFPSEHYPFWRGVLGRNEETFPFGAFGENLTLLGMTEENVRVGDVLKVGTAVVQVSQPMMPCVNLARRWCAKDLPERMIAARQTGFYLRVREHGAVGQGDVVILVERPNPNVTIATISDGFYQGGQRMERVAELARTPFLADEACRVLRRRLGGAPA